jgi:peptide/nickel transport system permease protein
MSAAAERAPDAGPLRLGLRNLARRRSGIVGLALVAFFVTTALAAPLIAPTSPFVASWEAIRQVPSTLHWMGTDEIGRDEFSRIVWGARASLAAGVVSVLIAAGIGVPAGLLAGFSGGFIDAVLSRVVDAMLAIPFLILAIALAAFLGPNLRNAMIAIGIGSAPVFMRVARAATLDTGRWDSRRAGSAADRTLRQKINLWLL